MGAEKAGKTHKKLLSMAAVAICLLWLSFCPLLRKLLKNESSKASLW